MIPPAALLPLVHKMAGHAAIILAFGASFAAVDFRDQVTLGSIIVTGVLLAIAALFTIRSRIAEVWREEAEGERSRADRLQQELTEALAERAQFEKDQQELRHDLKDKIAGLDTKLKVMEARTDLTAALEAIRVMNENTVAGIAAVVGDALAGAAHSSLERDGRTHALLEEIRDKLPNTPSTESEPST